MQYFNFCLSLFKLSSFSLQLKQCFILYLPLCNSSACLSVSLYLSLVLRLFHVYCAFFFLVIYLSYICLCLLVYQCLSVKLMQICGSFQLSQTQVFESFIATVGLTKVIEYGTMKQKKQAWSQSNIWKTESKHYSQTTVEWLLRLFEGYARLPI